MHNLPAIPPLLRRLIRSVLLFAAPAMLSAAVHAAAPDKGLGINLHSIHYWSPALPFADVFKQAGGWIPQREGSQAWNTGESLDLDENGWVRYLTPGQQAATVVMTGARYPAGRYLVSYDGQGEIFLGLDARFSGKRGKDLWVDVQPKNSVILKVMKTNPADPLRNIRMYAPGLDPAHCTSTFNPVYLDYLEGFKVIRFMDWSNANQNDVVDWAERTRPEQASQDRKPGAALEYMIQFAAEANASPWFTVPHAASDDYVREMAQLIKARVKADRKFYLEYSNEVWNAQFPQYAYAVKEAARLGLKDADEYYLRRSLQVFRIFEEVFGGAGRFVRVLSGQAVNTWRAKKLMAYPGLGRYADAYAIAPYFGHQGQLLATGLDPKTAPIEKFLARLDDNVAATREVIRANQVLSRGAGLQLIAYEAGQHVTNPPGQDDFCAKLNRHPHMGELYRRYLDIWEQETGGALMVMFADMSNYGRSGCWGLSEYHGQDLSTAPKLQAVRQYLHRQAK